MDGRLTTRELEQALDDFAHADNPRYRMYTIVKQYYDAVTRAAFADHFMKPGAIIQVPGVDSIREISVERK